MTMESQLLINGQVFPAFSCRNIMQTLTPEVDGEFLRSVNGKLCFIGECNNTKYSSIISCNDINIPDLSSYIGQRVELQCITKIWHNLKKADIINGIILLKYKFVPSSIEIFNHIMQEQKYVLESGGETLKLMNDTPEDVLVCYRPILNMIVTNFSFTTQEWDNKNNWTLTLKEI